MGGVSKDSISTTERSKATIGDGTDSLSVPSYRLQLNSLKTSTSDLDQQLLEVSVNGDNNKDEFYGLKCERGEREPKKNLLECELYIRFT